MTRDNLLTGEAVNLSGSFTKNYGIGGISNTAGTNFWWSQNTPYHKGLLNHLSSRWINIDPKNWDLESVGIRRQDYRYYYNHASYIHIDIIIEILIPIMVLSRVPVTDGNMLHVVRYDYYTSSRICYANYQIFLRNSQWDTLYTCRQPQQ